jgi:lipopolysaccharide export system permease protein
VRIHSIIRPLDRYVFSEFWRIFLTTALGFPILVSVIDLTDNLDKYLARDLTPGRIAISYVYWLPDSIFMVLPAAVLFATVFSIGTLTRHSEITAAKASGISFYRFIAPIFFGALIATIAGFVLGEIAPMTNKLREEALGSRKSSYANERYNFAYASEGGRTYKITTLSQGTQSMTGVQIDRKGRWPDYPSYVLSAGGGVYRPDNGWTLSRGAIHIMTSDRGNLTFSFDSLYDKHLIERPIDLAVSPSAPTEMRFRELGRFIAAMERSGADVNQLRVERMLKITIPMTCLVILLFGAPLATSTQRGGAAYGIGISLATTIIFLIMIQMTKAIGSKGVIPPELAAWIPSLLFGTAGAILFTRVRT